MSDTTPIRRTALAWGANDRPDDLLCVWGARLIAPRDLLHDRQDLGMAEGATDADKQKLIAWLNGPGMGNGAISKALEACADLSYTKLDGSKNETVVVYEDEHGKMVANAQGSYGYIYIAGWLHEHDQQAAALLSIEEDEAAAGEAERG